MTNDYLRDINRFSITHAVFQKDRSNAHIFRLPTVNLDFRH